jgi:hypothetical protein
MADETMKDLRTRPIAERVVSPEASAQQAFIHREIGLLISAWANTESVLIAAFHSMLGSDRATATTIFHSMAAKPRLDMLGNLARVKLATEAGEELASIIKHFKRLSRLRNHYAHCEYGLNEQFFYTGTYGVDWSEDLIPQGYVTFKPMDEAAINEIRNTQRLLGELNLRIWKFVEKLPEPPSAPPAEGTESPKHETQASPPNSRGKRGKRLRSSPG